MTTVQLHRLLAVSFGALCSAALVEWLLLKPCCVDMCGILFVMYGSSSSPVFLLSRIEVKWVCMMWLCSCLYLVLEL